MDNIILKDMVFYGYHGVMSEENTLGQNFRINAELHLFLGQAGRSDDLSCTVSYAEVYELCKKLATGKPNQLIETLAEKIASGILKRFPLVCSCKIEVIKESPPIPHFGGTASVVIFREQLPYTCYVGLGSNIGDRKFFLRQAEILIERESTVLITKKSSIYENKPIGYVEQGDFLNKVIEVKTCLTPLELLKYFQQIELKLGRKREIKWGPRTIDIDILTYNDQTIELEGLTIPHPEMKQRDFVLIPLAEITTTLKIKGTSITIADLIKALPKRKITRK